MCTKIRRNNRHLLRALFYTALCSLCAACSSYDAPSNTGDTPPGSHGRSVVSPAHQNRNTPRIAVADGLDSFSFDDNNKKNTADEGTSFDSSAQFDSGASHEDTRKTIIGPTHFYARMVQADRPTTQFLARSPMIQGGLPRINVSPR